MMIGLPRAILFDLDDTILTEGDRFSILLEVAERLHAQLRPHPAHEVAEALEAALTDFWASPAKAKAARLGSHFGIRQARELVIAETFTKLDIAELDSAVRAFGEAFSEARRASTRLFEDARNTLKLLRHMGFGWLLSPMAPQIFKGRSSTASTCHVCSTTFRSKANTAGKPEDLVYLHALEALRLEPQDAWMVGGQS
jgi:putative hydrolase of the HAD superfamily